MLDFYQQVRADGCAVSSDRDMLLFQWGTYDWGQGRFFNFDITRQFTQTGENPTDPDDNTMSQLKLTFYYCPNPILEALKSGNRWCHSPEELPEFRAFVISSASYAAANSTIPAKIELDHALV